MMPHHVVNPPLVSVGLQFFNNKKTLERAIRSILQQTLADWELLIHDDGSHDDGAALVARFQDPRIRFFPDSVNRRRPYRINESLDTARGQFYALMDADDVAYPDRLRKQVEFLTRHSDIDLLGGGMMVFSEDGAPLGKRQPPVDHKEICSRPLAGIRLSQPTFMGRIDWFRRYRYAEDCFRAQDQDLLLRSFRYSRFANLPSIIVGYQEGPLRWRRIARDRFFFSRAACRQFWSEGRFILAATAILLQSAKSAVDAFAIATGPTRKLLRHRARPVTSEEIAQWRQVWQSVNDQP